MKQNLLLTSMLLILSSCAKTPPPSHPANPNYAIIKPSVKYHPSKQSLEKMVKDLQGSPYVWAEEGPNTFDCSGFTYYMYGSMGIELPRVAREQAKVGKRIRKEDLQYGDLIFFATNRRNHRKITHVGMYLGDGWFTHASTVTHEVVYSNLNTSAYYKRKLRICRRYLTDNTINLAKNRPFWKKTKPFKVTQMVNQTEEIEKGEFYIQVGSFKGYPSATLIQKINTLGFNHKLIQFKINQQLISKLLIGAFRTRRQAENLLPKVKQYIEASAYIAQIQ